MSAEVSVARVGWTKLRQSGKIAAEREVLTEPTDVETGIGPARLALGQMGEARLLLPLPASERLPDLQDGQSLQLRVTQLEVDRKLQRFLDLTCRDAALEPVFNEVVDEILDRIRRGAACTEACTSTLKDFRELLDPVPQAKIDVRRIRGLLGELIYLERLLALDARAWELWRGPLKQGERHDFRGGSWAVEIKTTSRVSATRVRISSIDQLESAKDGALHLVKLVLEEAVGAPLTISVVARRILARSSSPEDFRSRLSDVGCEDHSAPAWNTVAFQLEGEETFEVRTGFPRIVGESFIGSSAPAGVSGVEYDIDLGAAKPFLIDSDAARQIADRLILCL